MARFYETAGAERVDDEVRTWTGMNAESEEALLSIRKDNHGVVKRTVNSRVVDLFSDPIGRSLEQRFEAFC